jgi:protein TonB
VVKDSRFQAFGLAVVVEVVLLTGAAFALTHSEKVKAVTSPASIITLANEEPQPPKPPEPKPKPLPQPKPIPIPQPQVVPEEPKPVLPQVVEAQVNTFTEPVPPPPPEPVVGKAEPSAEYAAKVHAAVQAAHYYPPAAVSLRFSGRVRVEFHLRDVAVSEIRLLVASGIGMIDRAALQAVQNAKYPEPPPEIQGTEHVYQVWVEFTRK